MIQEEGFHGQKTQICRLLKSLLNKEAGFASAMDKERGHLDRVSLQKQLSLRSAEPTPGW